jgi:hypothetical protein
MNIQPLIVAKALRIPRAISVCTIRAHSGHIWSKFRAHSGNIETDDTGIRGLLLVVAMALRTPRAISVCNIRRPDGQLVSQSVSSAMQGPKHVD